MNLNENKDNPNLPKQIHLTILRKVVSSFEEQNLIPPYYLSVVFKKEKVQVGPDQFKILKEIEEENRFVPIFKKEKQQDDYDILKDEIIFDDE